jgi:hypothetical protein
MHQARTYARLPFPAIFLSTTAIVNLTSLLTEPRAYRHAVPA